MKRKLEIGGWRINSISNYGLIVGVGLVGVCLIYALGALVLQRAIIFPGQYLAAPPDRVNTPPGLAGLADLDKWWLETDQGLVEAWFMPMPQASKDWPAPVVIYTHGNGELIDYWPEALAPFLEQGISLLLVEYPGYGRSAGKPSQKLITAVMLAAYDRLLTRPDVDPGRIMAYGRSLGGGAACLLAGRRPIAALILQSTFVSLRQLAPGHGLPGFLVLDPLDNAAVVRDYPGPMLIIHGLRDEVIPFSHGETLAQIAPQATLISYACGHNDCPPSEAQFWADILAFLGQAGMLTKK